MAFADCWLEVSSADEVGTPTRSGQDSGTALLVFQLAGGLALVGAGCDSALAISAQDYRPPIKPPGRNGRAEGALFQQAVLAQQQLPLLKKIIGIFRSGQTFSSKHFFNPLATGSMHGFVECFL